MSLRNFCLFVFFLFFSFGCTSTKDKKTTLLLDWLPNPGHIPLFAGQDKGFFKEEGIDLEILKLADPPSAIAYLETKRVDIVLYYMPSTIKAASRLPHLRVLGVLVKEPLDAFVYREDSGIKDPESMDQKVLGCQSDAILLTYAKAAMEKKGFSFKEIKKLEIDPIFALYTNMVDVVSSAFWTIEPAQLEALGVKANFIKVTDLGVPSYYELIFVTREDFLLKEPCMKQRFQRALDRSIRFCKQHPEEAFEIYLQHYPHKDHKTISWEKRAWEKVLPTLSDSQDISVDLFEEYHNWMRSQNILEQDVDLKRLL